MNSTHSAPQAAIQSSGVSLPAVRLLPPGGGQVRASPLLLLLRPQPATSPRLLAAEGTRAPRLRRASLACEQRCPHCTARGPFQSRRRPSTPGQLNAAFVTLFVSFFSFLNNQRHFRIAFIHTPHTMSAHPFTANPGEYQGSDHKPGSSSVQRWSRNSELKLCRRWTCSKAAAIDIATLSTRALDLRCNVPFPPRFCEPVTRPAPSVSLVRVIVFET